MSSPPPLSDYEKRRLANIARNQRVLGNLGIDAAAVRKAALLDRVRAVLLSYPAGPNAKDRTPLPSRDIVLCCLAFSCNVLDEAISGFSNQQRKQAATR